MITPKAFVFDMDGVLIDTESLYVPTMMSYFNSLHMHVTPEIYLSLIGKSATANWTFLKKKFNLAEDLSYYKMKEKEIKYEFLSTNDLKPQDGLVQLLEKIKNKKLPIAVASMGARKNIEMVLSKLNIATYFDQTLSGEDVTHGKPQPDIYIKACKLLNQNPKDCVAIEDSKSGVASAKSAGLYTIGYINVGSGNQDLRQADEIINHYEALSTMLAD